MPDNTLPIPAFKGDKDDTALIDVIPLLQGILNAKADASKVLPNWNKVKDPGAAYVKDLKARGVGGGAAAAGQGQGAAAAAQQQPDAFSDDGEAPAAFAPALAVASDGTDPAAAAAAAAAAASQHWVLFGVRIW